MCKSNIEIDFHVHRQHQTNKGHFFHLQFSVAIEAPDAPAIECSCVICMSAIFAKSINETESMSKLHCIQQRSEACNHRVCLGIFFSAECVYVREGQIHKRSQVDQMSDSLFFTRSSSPVCLVEMKMESETCRACEAFSCTSSHDDSGEK